MARINIAHGAARPAGLGPSEPWLDDATGIMYVGDRPVTGSNRNILVNGDFQVNQRGQSRYTGFGYAVDMWKIESQEGTSIDVQGDGVQAVLSAGYGSLTQAVEGARNYRGLTLTASVEVERCSGGNTFLYINDGIRQAGIEIDGPGIYTVTRQIENTANVLYVRLQNNHATETTTIKIKRAKLELGPISTLALDGPADYGAELARCQRYLYVFNGSNAIWVGSGTIGPNNLDAMIPLPVPMRILPSVTGTYNFFNGVRKEPGPTIMPISMTCNALYVSGRNTTTVTTVQTVFLTLTDNKKLLLSAEP